MPLPTFTGLGPYPEFEDVVRKINTLVQELQNLMLSLDDANFSSITAEVINVDELSAISANLGTITAGLLQAVTIYGSLIATSAASYPRVELSTAQSLFLAALTTNKFIDIEAISGSTGTTVLQFRDGDIPQTVIMYLSESTNQFFISSTGTIQITSLPAGDIHLNGANVIINGVTTGGTVYVSATPGGPADVPITFINGLRTS